MNPLIECVPNFSEGRRPEVVSAILAAIQSVPGVVVLDHSSDADHNRTVVTYVGTPEAVEEAAFQAIRMAAQHIDLTQHDGEHPRIGATDVVPFIPLQGATMDDAIGIAKRLGKRVGDELSIPVYLYEKAATHPDRENLAKIRKGEFEGLRESIQSDDDRAPDYGPSELGTAGATVIGARAPLIAYNIYLNTDNVDTANEIARAVRHSGGGLRFVKALGMEVDGRAQVSMNMTDFSRTPLHRVTELIRIEAERHGVLITEAELVGLIPEQALIDAARWYLQLSMFDEDQILERKLRAAEADDTTPQPFLNAVASSDPTPGGGSVAALAGALAAALATMVARTTIGKKKYADVEMQMQSAVAGGEQLRQTLTRLIDEDAEAFTSVMDAYRLPKESEGRAEAIQGATLYAAEVPLRTAERVLDTLAQLHIVAEMGNVNAATDAAAGAHLALAAVEAAALNVMINIKGLEDDEAVSMRKRIEEVREEAGTLVAAVIHTVMERTGL